MIKFNSLDWFSGSGQLTSPAFYTNGANQILSFWMYRDAYSYSSELVNIYLSESLDIAGVAPIMTINRDMAKPPAESAEGWHRYFVLLPCASMTTAYVTFEGVANFGRNMYIDNIEIGDVCVPPIITAAELYGDAYPSNHARLAWDKPTIETAFLQGYKIYRNDALIATLGKEVLEYNDETDLVPGEYIYHVASYYNNDCEEGKSLPTRIFTVVDICQEAAPPTGLAAEIKVDQWYDIQLSWEAPAASGILGYYVFENGELITPDYIADETYYRTVSDEGVYIYEVAAIYEDFCESGIRVQSTVEMPKSPCDNVWETTFTEGFEYPRHIPWCWTGTTNRSPWHRVTEGVSPECAPQEGDAMMRLNNLENYWGSNDLLSPPFLSGGENQILTFWMYRDGQSPGTKDRVSIYLSESESIAGLSPLVVINRSTTLSPEVKEEGWYTYSVELPCADMEQAYVIFRGTSDYGSSDIYLDNITIGDACAAPENVTALLFGDELPYSQARISWEIMPAAEKNLSGYNVYKNGVLLAQHITAAEYVDHGLAAGEEYVYAVEALYDNDCGKSALIYSNIIKVNNICSDVLAPGSVMATAHAGDWHNVDLFWRKADMLAEYCGEPVNGIGRSIADEFIMAIRYKPDDLAGLHGAKLNKVSFVPGASSEVCDYYIQIWEGGSGRKPGMLIVEELITESFAGGLEWKTVALTKPAIIDASKELWIAIRCVTSDRAYPVVHDAGPTFSPFNSNIFYADGRWIALPDADSQFTYNWCLKGHIDIGDTGEEEIVGYNIYRNNALINSEMITSFVYTDNVGQAGEYLYEVAAVYSNACESEKRCQAIVDIKANPCDDIWQVPFTEGFETGPILPWCWESRGVLSGFPMSINWEYVFYGLNPECFPRNGDRMLKFRSYNYVEGVKGYLITPLFVTDDDYELSFWMYRNKQVSDRYDKISVYLSESTEVDGLEPLLTTHRSIALDPAVDAEGWYEYRVSLNTADMDGAHVIFEFESGFGNNIFIDDITVFNPKACDPASNIKAVQPVEGEVALTWDAPFNEGLKGYSIARDGVIIVAEQAENSFIDTASLGEHEYCITALFDKSGCGQSAEACISVDVIAQCNPVKAITATVADANTVQVEWVAPDAIGIVSYSLYRDGLFLTNTEQTSHLDENVDAGAYIYSVIVNYENKAYAASMPVFSDEVKLEYCTAVTNLSAAVEDGVLVLNWDYAGGEGFSEIVFNESFEYGIPAAWFNLDKDNDGFIWKTKFSGGINTGGYIFSESYGFNEEQDSFIGLYPDNWLITKQLELSGKESLTYYIKAGDSRYPEEQYAVYISTEGTDYNDFKLLFEETLTEAEGTWTERELGLQEYSGKAYIAFRHYNCYDNYTLNLDEVRILGEWGYPLFDVYKDDAYLGRTENKTFTDNDVSPNQQYIYCIHPVYDYCSVEAACVVNTSIGNFEGGNISVYPNPASSRVYVEGKNIKGISVYNLFGSLVEHATVAQGEQTALDISSYTVGGYIFKIVRSDGSIAIKKIIVVP
jgi:MAM domain./Cleaved Adhesin Domain.